MNRFLITTKNILNRGYSQQGIDLQHVCVCGVVSERLILRTRVWSCSQSPQYNHRTPHTHSHTHTQLNEHAQVVAKHCLRVTCSQTLTHTHAASRIPQPRPTTFSRRTRDNRGHVVFVCARRVRSIYKYGILRATFGCFAVDGCFCTADRCVEEPSGQILSQIVEWGLGLLLSSAWPNNHTTLSTPQHNTLREILHVCQELTRESSDHRRR